ncbi:putative esterase [Metallosphaera sedula]|uniref:S-formylglutathione hydrolase n=3 Tax=Metallosphaera TaxID=41980 RepID=A4YGP5_METS5|nr:MULTISPECIES: alpha/beta hydrolase-fold protein [Metallosphaera]ABP95597.1 putative esterase [Metallosphaera sedula DSM 5348]AIM27581.1 putative esterase [Metallosphaera sedula]AKV74441.1 esterase [Metallosphaera sedula]AKV76680.1 esterase [Metallosphaera sedula]AKV78931.1 esterase [Metallosphaera sedula]
MEIEYLEIESDYLRDNPWKDTYKRKVAVVTTGSTEDIPGILYLSGYFSTSLTQLNLDPLSESLKDRVGRLYAERNIGDLALILPDTFTSLGGNQYLDSKAIGLYESFLMKELVPLVREKYQITSLGVMGKSSGGYGALHLGSKYDFQAIAIHSADAYFEYAYLPLFPRVIQTLRRTGTPKDFVSMFWAQQDRKRRDLLDAMMIIGLSAFYSPTENVELPFELETGRIREEVWRHWLSLDPVRFLEERKEKLRGKSIYIDVGDRDDFHLQYGNRIIHEMLNNWKIAHVYEEFHGGHMNTSYRYDVSLVYLYENLKAK